MVDIEGRADLVQKGSRQGRQGGKIVDIVRQVVDEHGELVARKAADDGVLAQAARETLAQDLQSTVAGGVAEGVVDFLEPVQVEIEQRERTLTAARARDRLLQQMLKLHAIR